MLFRTMKRFLTALLVFGFLVSAALATWAPMTLEELLKQTDAIVVARLTDVKETTKRGTDYGSGTLTVTEVIRGVIKSGGKLRLEWSNRSEVYCPRVEHKPHEGKTRIWLLQASTNGAFTANYPLRVLEVEKRKELDDLLKKK